MCRRFESKRLQKKFLGKNARKIASFRRDLQLKSLCVAYFAWMKFTCLYDFFTVLLNLYILI